MADTAFQIQYRQEFIAGFAQRQSILRDSVTHERMIKGNQATFLISNSSASAVTRGVNGEIPARTNDLTQTTATLLEKHDLVRMTGFNIFASQGDQNEIMQMESMGVINRDIDATIIAILDTATLDTGAAATASLNMVGKAWVHLLNNKVPNDGQLFGLVTPAFLFYLMQMDEFASADFVVTKPYLAPPAPNMNDPRNSIGVGYYNWMNIHWMVHPGLTGIGTAAEKCYLYHRAAVGHAVNKAGIDARTGYHEEQDYSWARTSLYHGAVKLQNTGIGQMLHDGSAYVLS